MRAHPVNIPFVLENPLCGPHCKVRMVRDFNHLTTNVRGAMLQTLYKLNLKPKTILKLKGGLQQIRDDSPQTFAILSECMRFFTF